uniref:Putative F-box/LRR-repeat protein C02F5.7 n=1 Tax=Noccaea caerulescens TaxID=107243 RepID=A0A1J3HUX9_NOCCA
MEEVLFDEILQEIFTRLPSSSSLPSFELVPLVSKRWLRLYRASKTSMSLRINPFDSSVITLLPSILHNHPSLSSLSFIFDPEFPTPIRSASDDSAAEANFNASLISIVSSCCVNLGKLSLLVSPVSSSSLLPLSVSSSLTCLSLELLRPVSFNWVASFKSLKDLSIEVSSRTTSDFESGSNRYTNLDDVVVEELGLESISLTGIQSDDTGVTWLWKRCRKMKKMSLKSCGTIGETEFFGSCLKNLEEIELRTCRSVADVVLLKVSEICESLKSLLIYDGGNKDGLDHFMNNSKCNDTLKRLDLRLPMDLIDDHLVSLAENFRSLSTLRLASCYFVTGLSLKVLALSFSSSLEELSLLSCDAVERESGLLATLGQDLGRLRKLELPFNEWLSDKELVSMLASCGGLVELNLRGCKSLTGSVLVALNKSCVKLRTLDVVSCRLIEGDDVEAFVVKSQKLEKIVVEEKKITADAIKWASSKLIQVVAVDSDLLR